MTVGTNFQNYAIIIYIYTPTDSHVFCIIEIANERSIKDEK